MAWEAEAESSLEGEYGNVLLLLLLYTLQAMPREKPDAHIDAPKGVYDTHAQSDHVHSPHLLVCTSAVFVCCQTHGDAQSRAPVLRSAICGVKPREGKRAAGRPK